MLFRKKSKSVILYNMHDFAFSKKQHFNYFKENKYDSLLFGSSVDPSSCDLKIYQDLLIFAFLIENIAKGSRVLEIGGGDSRIRKYFLDTYEFWSIDPLEGVGDGPKQLREFPGGKFILDYMGNFNKDLPDNYFDFVFSISSLEHAEDDNPALHKKICDDIDRVLKKKSFSLHCLDMIFNRKHEDGYFYNCTCGVTPYMIPRYLLNNKFMSSKDYVLDDTLFCMSEVAYNRCIKIYRDISYENFGQPFSYNILWQKPGV